MQNFSLSAGAQIAHYRVERQIGAGGMGEVFLGTDLTLERRVALKILPPALLSDGDRVRRFVQEAKSASALNHPNIVTIYEIGQSAVTPAGGTATDDRVHYMAMEFIDGKTLREAIYGGTPLKDLLDVLAQAADGLAKAHGAGIVHRDLKPDNIMITSDGYAKVVDFGLAKLTEKKSDPGGGQDKSITQSGVVMGTVGYMSPEQIDGSVIRPPSDVFAFGCILYEAVTKKRPFQSELAIDTLHKIMFSEPAPLVMHVSDAPADLQAIIDRCLRKNPDERYASMREVAAAIRAVIGSGPTAKPERVEVPVAVPSPGSGDAVRPRIEAKPLRSFDDTPVRQRSVAGRVASLAFKFALLAIVGLAIYAGATLPDVSKLASGKPDGIAGTWTELEEHASSVRRAAVASLDPDFFDRKGLRVATLGTALSSLTTPQRKLYLPSPVAVRAAEAIYGGGSANPATRARMWAIAAAMHSKLSSNRILELYLNSATYGDMTGVADAAKKYFKKTPRRLNGPEAAMLVASAQIKASDPVNPSEELLALRQSLLDRAGAGEPETERADANGGNSERAVTKKSKKRPQEIAPASAITPSTTAPSEPPPTETAAPPAPESAPATSS